MHLSEPRKSDAGWYPTSNTQTKISPHSWQPVAIEGDGSEDE